MAQTLSGYITQTRRLLHDVNANFWTDAELTDYINDGRNTLVRDTGCNRVLQSYTAPASVETISFSALPQGDKTIDVINVNLYWGNSRIPLYYLAWTDFNAQLRYWQNYVGRPVCFSVYGQNTIYVGPVPDQAYVVEIDSTILPTALSLNTPNANDQIQDPYTTPVAFYAAYKAKYKEQSYGEAEIYKQEYAKQIQAVLNSVYTRRIPDPYSTF